MLQAGSENIHVAAGAFDLIAETKSLLLIIHIKGLRKRIKGEVCATLL